VGEEILRELVADRLAEVEQVGGEKARQTAWGGGCMGQEGGSQRGRCFEYLLVRGKRDGNEKGK
jgi:hypothetical protein